MQNNNSHQKVTCTNREVGIRALISIVDIDLNVIYLNLHVL